MLDSACHRPQAGFFGQQAYPTLAGKAAALMHSLAGNMLSFSWTNGLAAIGAVRGTDIPVLQTFESLGSAGRSAALHQSVSLPSPSYFEPWSSKPAYPSALLRLPPIRIWSSPRCPASAPISSKRRRAGPGPHLVDGNKRLALLATVVFLRLNGHRLDLTDDEALYLTMAIAAGQLDADGIEKRVRPAPT